MAEKNKGGRPPKFKSPEDMQVLIDEYFTVICADEVSKAGTIITHPPTVSGLAIHLGFCDRASVYDYGNKDEFSYTIKQAICRIEDYAQKCLMNGKQATGAIFWLKNHGWKDRTEQKVEVGELDLLLGDIDGETK